MATKSTIPVVKINRHVRRRLLNILAGKESRQNPSIYLNSPGLECQLYLGHSQQRDLLQKKGGTNKSFDCRLPDIATSSSKLEHPIFISPFISREIPLKRPVMDTKEEKDVKKKREDTATVEKRRVFRRFMRSVACSKSDTKGNICRNVTEKTLPEEATRVADQINFPSSKIKDTRHDFGDSRKCCLKDATSQDMKTEFKMFDLAGETGASCKDSDGSQQIADNIGMIDDRQRDSSKAERRRENRKSTLERISSGRSGDMKGSAFDRTENNQTNEELDESYFLNTLFDPKNHTEKGSKNLREERDNFSNESGKGKTKKKKRRKTRKDKCEENSLSADCIDVGDDMNKPSSIDSKNKQKKLPNYFLALRVDDPVITENVKKFQSSVIEKEPAFKNVLIDVQTLHLTLVVMRLENEEEITNAQQALQSTKEILQESFAKHGTELVFNGIETFRKKVIYLGLDKENCQDAIIFILEAVKALRQGYKSFDVLLTEESKQNFTPHVTVMKMSKNAKRMKQKGIKCVDDKYFDDFLKCEFGKQTFSEITLCSMLDKKGSDGFYKVIDRIALEVSPKETSP